MQIDYVEFTAPDLSASRAFFEAAFGWGFVDYGPDYAEITGAGVSGGVERGEARAPLVILRTGDLEAALASVTGAGAEITRTIFAFPGGRRFHFRVPGGGPEMAVWSPA